MSAKINTLIHAKSIRILSLVLCLITVFGAFSTLAYAAERTSNYKQFTEPSGSDYAYWNGKKMVKHSGTSKSNVQWMQAMFNWLREKGYFNFDGSYLECDGSFGPASKKACLAFQKKAGLTADGSCGPKTIERMKKERDNILNKNKPTTKSNSTNQTTDLIWPIVDGKGTVTAIPGSRSYEKHVGTDIGTGKENPAIIAVASGTVIKTGYSEKERGYYVAIRHGKYICMYQHMKNQTCVSEGQTVSQGQTLGYVGSTGRSSGNHLHFEIVLESTLSGKASKAECLWYDINKNIKKPTYYSVSRGEKVGQYYKLNLKQV